DAVGDTHHVDQILARGTVFFGIVVFPVFHEQADHLPALTLEQQGRNGGIDTAGQADHHSFFRHRAQPPSSSRPAARSPPALHYRQTSYRRRSVAPRHPFFLQSPPSSARETHNPSSGYPVPAHGGSGGCPAIRARAT